MIARRRDSDGGTAVWRALDSAPCVDACKIQSNSARMPLPGVAMRRAFSASSAAYLPTAALPFILAWRDGVERGAGGEVPECGREAGAESVADG